MTARRSLPVKLLILLALAAWGAGCATAPPESDVFNQARLVVKQPVELELPTTDFELFHEDSPFVREALRDFEETGKAPAIRRPGFVVYPYGEVYPILYCKPVRVCDIQLQPGEEVDASGVALGDSERWISGIAYSGSGKERVAHILVKPTFLGISTNLVIMTSRRTYHLGLISKDRDDYTKSAKFYYPRDLVNRWNTLANGKNPHWLFDAENSSELPRVTNVEALDFGYRISGDNPPWKPIRAFNDGERTFVQMPEVMKSYEAPALFLKDSGSDRQIVNYRVRGDFYIVDRLFEEAVMVVGVGRHQDKVVISRQGMGSRFRRWLGLGRSQRDG